MSADALTVHAIPAGDLDELRRTEEGADIEAPLRELLADPVVREVHVRAATAQCFTHLARADR